MNIQNIIAKINVLKPNQYNANDIIAWLSDIDGQIYKEVVLTHSDSSTVVFNGYDSSTPLSTELIAPDPYSELYIHYIMAQIDYYNAEWGRYNNTSAMFNVAYQDFVNYWNRNHMSVNNNIFTNL